MSTELSVASFDYLGEAWTLIDCPGSVELGHEARCAMMVADAVVVVCEPQPERAVAVSSLLRFLDERDIPHLIFVNKMDQPKASVRATLEALQAYSTRPLLLREIPMRDEAGQVTGMVDLVSERAWRWQPHQASALVSLPERLLDEEGQARSTLLEALADFDDRLMEELLEDVVPSTDDIYQNLTRDLQDDLVVPVFFGSAENGNGIHRLLKALRHEVPASEVTAARRGISTDQGPTAEVFRTLFAGQTGKVSLARVWAGEIRDGLTLGRDRIGGVSALMGRKSTSRRSAQAGEVVALSRMASAATGDLLCGERGIEADWPEPPPPLFAVALSAQRQSDDVKLTSALGRMCQEDPSLKSEHNPETGELIVSGQGDLHLQIMLSRLQSEYGLTVTRERPTLPYRETITRPGQQHARHKKQSGGHGEFADVLIEVRPEPRGSGFRFADRITGAWCPSSTSRRSRRGSNPTSRAARSDFRSWTWPCRSWTAAFTRWTAPTWRSRRPRRRRCPS
ncbi:Translation elongation factor G-related protein [Rubellimicrobium mesophilum DSM 19309]|uniref:Translation elongation factor G-related protein n=1 Tax=Rubellimicrobium mesophilum DSM 19309 TaxID=442562 RepID=A0A017HV48_9RHOB|nr:Translation elongation factor G-related protein [Rubellimicrobium mesophilum DSM 19309]